LQLYLNRKSTLNLVKEVISIIAEFAKRLEEIENLRKKTGKFLRELNSAELQTDREILEKKVFLPVEKKSFEKLKVAGVDGGLLKKSLHGIDFIILRSVGVIFDLSSGNLVNSEYYPSAIPDPTPHFFQDPFSEIEFEISTNIFRQIAEVNTAREVVEKYSPDIIFLNGSIIPHYIFNTERNSIIFPHLQKLISSYQALFETVATRQTLLAGVIEDTRGMRFSEIINSYLASRADRETITGLKILLMNSKDTNLLMHALQFPERTFVFNYSSSPSHHPVLREFGNFSEKVFTFYLKNTEFDRPLRIDFLGDKNPIKSADEISSIILNLTGHSNYAMPSVLIEADQRAKLSESDLQSIMMELMNHSGNLPSLFELRRNQRPF